MTHRDGERSANAPGFSTNAEFDIEAIRREFPIFSRELPGGRTLHFLDSGASTQKPRCVLDKEREVSEQYYANAYRGVYRFGARVDDELESAREEIRSLIGAASSNEIAFVGGATLGLNMISFGWGRAHLRPGDEIAFARLEHHANYVPWQQVANDTGASIVELPLTDVGEIDIEAAADVIGPRTRIVAITGMSNVFGTMPDISTIAALAHREGAVLVVDGSQSVPHRPTDVIAEGIDFLVFSGHKLYGPTGVGVVYGREDLLNETEPIIFGGHMIDQVTPERSTWAPPPARFEAGTLPITQAIGLGEAVRFVKQVGLERIAAHEHQLLVAAENALATVPGVRRLGPDSSSGKGAILSFTMEGAAADDVARLLDRKGVFVRHGHHCTMPLHDELGIPASIRASFAMYNTLDDVKALRDGLVYARQRLRLE